MSAAGASQSCSPWASSILRVTADDPCSGSSAEGSNSPSSATSTPEAPEIPLTPETTAIRSPGSPYDHSGSPVSMLNASIGTWSDGKSAPDRPREKASPEPPTKGDV